MILLCLIFGDFLKNHKLVLNFVESFICIYWDDHMVFVFQFVNMVYSIDWFVYIESLQPGIKPTWSWCMILLMYYWFLFARILLRIFALCSSVILACNFLLFVTSSSGFGIRVMVASWSKFRTLPSSAIFWKSLSSIGVSSSLNFW